MPVLFVILLLFLFYSFYLLSIMFFIKFLLSVWSYFSILNALLYKVWSLWIILYAIGDYFLHFYRPPVCKIAQNVGSFVLLNLIILWEWVSYSIHLAFIMSNRSWEHQFCKFTYSRRPNKHRHDIIATNPAVVLILRKDTPLRRSWHELFVSQLALNYKLLSFNPRHNGSHIVNSHWLDYISQL